MRNGDAVMIPQLGMIAKLTMFPLFTPDQPFKYERNVGASAGPG
jgi:hypothetical protein